MKVQAIMSSAVETCEPGTDLAAVAMTMWRRDCGIVPVVDASRRVVGVLTDRDICMAVATQHRRPEELVARDVMSSRLHTVRPDDDVARALEVMGEGQVRRLPVVDADRRLKGLVSMNDIVLHAQEVRPRTVPLLSANDVLAALQRICSHSLATAPLQRRERKPAAEAAHA
jgi:CBS domain-containing protein